MGCITSRPRVHQAVDQATIYAGSARTHVEPRGVLVFAGFDPYWWWKVFTKNLVLTFDPRNGGVDNSIKGDTSKAKHFALSDSRTKRGPVTFTGAPAPMLS